MPKNLLFRSLFNLNLEPSFLHYLGDYKIRKPLLVTVVSPTTPREGNVKHFEFRGVFKKTKIIFYPSGMQNKPCIDYK